MNRYLHLAFMIIAPFARAQSSEQKLPPRNPRHEPDYVNHTFKGPGDGTAKYTEYPGVGHDRWLKAYDEPEMWKWMFAQHRK